jgi:hypothetical protein
MRIATDERAYLTLVRVSGIVGNENRQKLFQELDRVLRSDPLGIVWDVTGIESITDLALSVLIGALAYQRLRRDPVIVVGATVELSESLRTAGVGYDAAFVSDEQEACLAMLERIPRRYDEFFCKVVVQEGYVKPDHLKQTLLRYEREGKGADFGKLLLREGVITAPNLLAAVCHQKTLLGDILVDTGKVTGADLEKALAAQMIGGAREKLGDLLLRLELASNEDVYEALARQYKRRQRLRKKAPVRASDGSSAATNARIGAILIEKRLLSQEDLDRSLQLQQQTKGRERLGDILVRLGFVSDSDLYNTLLTQYERTHSEGAEGDVRAGLEQMIQKLGSHDGLVIRQASEGLLALGRPATSLVIASMRNPSPLIRRACADLLGDGAALEAIPGLLECLEDAVPRVRVEALWSLVRITGQCFDSGDIEGWQNWWRRTDPRKLPPGPGQISSHREEMARILAQTLETRGELAPFELEYRQGQEEWEGGHVRMYLRGDGIVQVLHLRRGAVQTYAGDLGAKETREVLEAYSNAGILFLDTSRRSDDGAETRHELALRVGTRHFRRSVLFYRELFQHWSFRSFETRLRDVLRRLTRGAVLSAVLWVSRMCVSRS